MTRPITRRCLFSTAALLAALGASSAHAANFTWLGGSATFALSSNWSLTSGTDVDGIPDSDDAAFFTSGGTNPSIAADTTVGGIEFSGGQNYTLNRSAGVYRTASITVNGGTQTIAAYRTNGTPSYSIASGASLTFSNFRMDGVNHTFNATGNATAAAVDSGNASASVTKNNAGTLIFGSGGITNNFRDDGNNQITVNAGVFDLRTGYAVRVAGSGGELTKSTGGNVTVQPQTGSASFSGNMTGALNLLVGDNAGTRKASATQTLSGTNTYVGTTQIDIGALFVNGTHTSGGNYLLRSRTGDSTAGSGVLAGSGAITLATSSNTFTVQGNSAANSQFAILYPGASDTDTADLDIGSSTINTTVDFNDISIFRVDIGATGNADRLDIHGNLDLAGTGVRLELLGLGATAGTTNFDGSTYTIATFTGSLTDTFDSVWLRDTAGGSLVDITSSATTGFTVGGNEYKLEYLTNSIELTLVPEPGTLALAGVAALCLLPRRRA